MNSAGERERWNGEDVAKSFINKALLERVANRCAGHAHPIIMCMAWHQGLLTVWREEARAKVYPVARVNCCFINATIKINTLLEKRGYLFIKVFIIFSSWLFENKMLPFFELKLGRLRCANGIGEVVTNRTAYSLVQAWPVSISHMIIH